TDAGPVAGSAPPAMTTPEGSAEPASKDGGAEAASSSTDTVAAKPATPAAPVAEVTKVVATNDTEGVPGPVPPAPIAHLVEGDLDAARWNVLAEEVRMQVLQRIDILTDTGLHEQLTMRLQPIVDRASADLVAAINQHVGQLLRR